MFTNKIIKYIISIISTILILSGAVYAWTSLSSVSTNDSLTANGWNAIINKINSNGPKVEKLTATTCSAGKVVQNIGNDGTITCVTDSTGGSADDLGNHTATQDLNMGNKNIIGVNTITENGQLLSNKYLGKTAKSSDSDKLDGKDSIVNLGTDDTTIPTSKAVKTYVDTQIGGLSAGKFVDGTDPVEAVYSGNVGIGTTNPTEKLEVNGNTKISGRLRINGNVDGSTWKMGVTGNMIQREGNAVFGYNGGNVGIGTSSPSAKLDVNGNIKENGSLLSDKYLSKVSPFVRITAWSRITTSAASTSLNSTSCPVGYTIINWGQEKQIEYLGGSLTHWYGKCLKYGNGVQSSLYTQGGYVSSSHGLKCFGLCLKN